MLQGANLTEILPPSQVFCSVLKLLEMVKTHELLGISLYPNGAIKVLSQHLTELTESQLKVEGKLLSGELAINKYGDGNHDEGDWEDVSQEDEDEDEDEEAAAASEDKEEEEEEGRGIPGIADKIAARLFNILSSVAFLAGTT